MDKDDELHCGMRASNEDVPSSCEERFTGVITRIHDGAAYDASSFMIIDGKTVIFNLGGEMNADIKMGKLIGFEENPKFPYSGGEEELKTKYAGKKAEVFALRRTYDGFNNNGQLVRITEYILIGSEKYYIKLLK